MQINLLTRQITDIISMLILIIIGTYHLLSFAMRKKNKSDVYLTVFLLAFAAYIFFDNTISLLLFRDYIAAKINTVGASFCLFLMAANFYSFFYIALEVPKKHHKIKHASIIISFVLFMISFLVWKTGYIWYSEHISQWILTAYCLIICLNSGLCIGYAINNNQLNSTPTIIFVFSSHILILSLIVLNLLRVIDAKNYDINNFIIPIATVLFFPVLLISKSNREHIELTSLRQRLTKMEMPDDLQEQRINDFSETCSINATEKLVMQYLLKGLEYKEIAFHLKLSLSGIKKRVHSLYKKSNVQNRAELINAVFDISI